MNHRDRVVQVRSGGERPWGSGYLLEDGLVLTAPKVVSGGNGASPAEVRVDSVVRRARTVAQDGPVSLLRIAAAGRRLSAEPPLRWGRFVTTCTDFPVEVIGFRPGQGATVGLHGVVDVGSSTKRDRYHITITESDVAGLRGAPVIVGALLVGIVVHTCAENGWAWLSAVPVQALTSLPEVAKVVDPLAEPAEFHSVLTPTSATSRAGAGLDRGAPSPVAEHLRRWCFDDEWFSIKVITSRTADVAAGIVTSTRAAGWTSGFLAAGASEEEMDALGWLTTPALIVVEAADGRDEQVRQFLEIVDRRSRRPSGLGRITGAPRVRVLLLAPISGDWWEELRTDVRLLRDLPPDVVISTPG
ncbi:hypothetical protein [Actinokineospora fastidiosa]|uniref:Uncharacterized protein n=1 Tax=Actinokineospora fastidiosa TaxID=1816 RepID=A0A918GQT6_9PSEU|nr:hypothetical protein [Actinokineospora fastidiosa]GGS54697.1 hypothetical protein GCM10010171_57310 [Actinokineospora fastidiosa]